MKKFGKPQLKLIARFFKLVIPYHRKWLVILLLSVAGVLLGLVNPYIAKLVIDKAIGNRDVGLFVVLILIGGGIFILTGLADGVKQFLDRYIKLRVHFNLNKKVFTKIQSFPFSWFQDKSSGEHIYKINYDIERVTNFVTTTPPEAISLFPGLLFTLAIIFYLNWKMAVFSLCLTPFLYLPPYYLSRKMRDVWEDLIEATEDIFEGLYEVFSHIHLVKAFGKEVSSIRNYLRGLVKNIRIEVKNTRLGILSNFSSRAVSKIIIGLIAFYGGYQVIKGNMTLGSLTAIMAYLIQLTAIQSQSAEFFPTVAVGVVSCERIARILDEEAKIAEAENAKNVIFKKGGIIFKDVNFGYRDNEYVLRNMNFRLEGGSHIALVGPSGCGKTTMLHLILRLYDLWNGEVFVDDYNVKDLRLTSLKSEIGIALQEPFLWNDSVGNNIKYAKESAARSEITKAAQIASADEFVKDLPQGYETVIGENACQLSGGQKQRIAIARAIIKHPKILILDEAMSSLDSETEDRIIDNVKKELSNSTIIVVSHRMSTVKKMDSVYFLEGTDRMDIGVHANLLERNPQYRELFASQIEVPLLHYKNEDYNQQ